MGQIYSFQGSLNCRKISTLHIVRFPTKPMTIKNASRPFSQLKFCLVLLTFIQAIFNEKQFDHFIECHIYTLVAQ